MSANRTENSADNKRRGALAEHGSALLLAIFVLVLLSGMGVALLFLSETETKMTGADRRTKMSFALAEAGLEHARTALWNLNKGNTFTDDLIFAAGDDGVIDYNPASPLEPVWDGNDNVTSFTGFDDDNALAPFRQVGDGWYTAYLTNDPNEGELIQADANERVMITAIGAGPDRSYEVVQAIVLLRDFIPSNPPATITILGPNPNFASANSKNKVYEGEDCGGSGDGVPGLYMPVIGVVGTDAEADAEAGMEPNPSFQSDPGLTEEETVADLDDEFDPAVVAAGTGKISDEWKDCWFLHDMVEQIKVVADVVCDDGDRLISDCAIPASSPDRVIYADGDLAVGPVNNQEGALIVTGTLEISGRADWAGIIMVIGEGVYRTNGAGNGQISGALIIADVAGPDNVFGTADDCTGDEMEPATYDERGGGNSGTQFCTAAIDASSPVRPYEVVDFLQRR